MKHMLTTIAESAKKNPKDFALSVVLLAGLAAIFFITLWINANILN